MMFVTDLGQKITAGHLLDFVTRANVTVLAILTNVTVLAVFSGFRS